MDSPEERARVNIDRLLTASGWAAQDRRRANLGAAAGVAVREFPLATGEADYLLLVHRKAIGEGRGKPCAYAARPPAPDAAPITAGLWDAQIEAIANLEASLADVRPRALIQMATGSGKTFTTNGTHYHKRKIDRSPFNVDCMFVPKRGHLRLSRFEVGDPQTWLDYSDTYR